MGATPTTCIVVPTYNERDNVEALVGAIEETQLPGLRVLFVDDASPDGTADVVMRVAEARPWVNLLRRERKLGIGSAYQEGFRVALSETNADIVVEMDADLQHPASAVTLLVDAIRQGADVALGSRYEPGGGISSWSWARKGVSRTANAYSRIMLGLQVKDATSGLRAYTREAAREVAMAEFPTRGFEFQVAALYLLKGRAKVVEVPYVFVHRRAGESKLKLGDMAKFFLAVLRIAVFGLPTPSKPEQDRNTSGLGRNPS